MLVLTVLAAVVAVLLGAAPAEAHVVPSTVLALDVHERDITASVTMPIDDLAIASGIALPATGALSARAGDRVADYLHDHFTVTSGSRRWTTTVDDVSAADTQQAGTGVFPAVTASVRLTPPAGTSPRSFTMRYDAIVHRVVTADVFVLLHSDWAAGQLDSARELGAIEANTATDAVPPLKIDLADGSPWRGLLAMIALGVAHIATGPDHQLFLLSLLLPAALLATGGRWSGIVPGRVAVRRITAITLAFTAGHSVTLALGTLGLPVPQQPIEVLIAVSILVAAAHAARPLFPGREPLVAGLFGLVHGMAFSTTLTSMDLSGGQLVLSLLGFNLGIELMQLVVVLLVLPPLVVVAGTASFPYLRTFAAVLTALAAAGWLADRLGVPNQVASAADALGTVFPWMVLGLWCSAAVILIRRRVRPAAGAEDARPTAEVVLVEQALHEAT